MEKLYTIGPKEQFCEIKSYPFEIEENRYLLVHTEEDYYLIEDKCGHFGVSMKNGAVENGMITCPVHGISFNMKTGANENRPWENCVPINVFALIEKDEIFYFSPENPIKQ